MKRSITAGLFILLASIFVLFCYACAQEPQVLPAAFAVRSLEAAPSRVTAGSDVTVTAIVANTGGLPGNFSAALTMNGKEVAGKTVTVNPEKPAAVTFNITLDKPGDYTLQLGSASAALKVIAVEDRHVELKYDSGQSRDSLWAGYNGGFLIDFTPPNPPLYLTKVRICGGIYGVDWAGKLFDLYVLDAFYNPLFSSTYQVARFPVRSAFPYSPPQWVDFDVTPMNLTDKFFVYLYTSMNRHKGIHVGVDDSSPNEHSTLASGRPPKLYTTTMENFYPAGSWYRNTDQVNWMIRAAGTARVPAE
jgi:hypothetical protein